MDKKSLQAQWVTTMGEAEAIRLKYDGKANEMPADEMERWERAIDDADKIQKQITLLDREDAGQTWAKSSADLLKVAGGGQSSDPAVAAGRKSWTKLLQYGANNLLPADVANLKAYQADDMAGGGFFVLPMEISDQYLTLLKDLVFMRQFGTVIPVPNADSLGVPSIDTDPSDDDWTTELGTGNAESTAAAGMRVLKPHPMSKRVKLSRTLVRKAPIFETILLDRLAYKVSVTEEKGFMTGNGANQPLGIFTADSKGISTSRDVAAAGASAIVADDLLNVYFNLKAAYRKNARWFLNRTVVKAARKLKDSNNNYIWSTGIGPGQGYQGLPETLLGLPFCESEYASGTITTGLYTAVLGDPKFYWIADALDTTMQVLDQLYAETNQIGYILRKETDGMPVQEEAWSRLKQA